MTEEIYIDGTLMDLDAGKTNVQMIFQSPYLTDIQSIVSNRTSSVTLPATSHNKAAIGYLSQQQDSMFPYRKHRAIYKRDGVQMFDGKATLLSVTDKQIQMCFTWGNTDAFQKLFDTNLQELDLGRCSYPPPLLGQADYMLGQIGFGGGRRGVGVSALKVLTAIQTKCGVTGLTELSRMNSRRRYALALTTRNGDVQTRNQQNIHITTFGASNWQADSNYWLTTLTRLTGRDPHGYVNAYGIMNVSAAQKLTIFLRGNFTKNQYATINVSSHDMKVIFDKGDGWDYDNGILICHPTNLSPSTSAVWKYTFNFSQEIDVSDVQRMAIAICSDISSNSVSLQDMSISQADITPDYDTPEEVIYGSNVSSTYPVALNMPNMSCGQFIKNLLWMHGQFGYSLDGKTIILTDFKELFANKVNAIDWTDKLVTLQPKERQTKLDTAQKNYFRYKEADWYDNSKYQGALVTDDDTIDVEKEYCQSDFALIPQNSIPVWSKNEDDEWDFAGDNLPPILIAGLNNVVMLTACYNSGQRWNNLLNSYYAEYASVILHPVVVKCDLFITTADLNALDMRIPVYLKQTGCYYLIRKLTTKSGGLAEAELVKL